MKEKFLKLKKQILDREYGFLNPEQRRAVFAPDGPLLILAGAGSGKTTVIVSRIEYLIRYGNTYYYEGVPSDLTQDDLMLMARFAASPDPALRGRITELIRHNPVAPWRILAITFTNKAAAELKSRLEQKLGSAGLDIWAATFHSACVRILRMEIEKIGFSRSFTIYDTTDSRRVIKDCISRYGLDEKMYAPRNVLSIISNAKNAGETPDDMRKQYEAVPRMKQIANLYAAYCEALKKANALDFDDIILHTVRILRDFPETRQMWMNRFDHVLVDEYQDTNPLQYQLVALLRKKDGNLCVVGDDDQSIYRFRGATIENILLFEERFDQATVIKLERNYRSTQTILDAANNVIANNVGRKSKTLWTENGTGQKIKICCAYDEGHEADTIAAAIQKMHIQDGIPYNEFAVLYRTNAQSRAIEAAMRSHRIPARVIGGQSFFDRKEVKDIMSYLCLIVNPTDDLRLRRIINEPKRAIGDTTVAALAAAAESENISMLEACRRADEFPTLSRAREKLKAFAMMMVELMTYAECNPLNTIIEEVLERTGYAEALKSDENYEDRIENIAELNSAIVRYMQGEEEPTLFGFLERTSLLSDADDYEEADESVAMMTMHTAKGLEFNHVFIPGCEEGLFPSSMSTDEEGGIEEERRLCYVGITRAKKSLTMLYTRMRMLYGTTMYPQMSRFVDEIPQTLYTKVGAPEGERQTEQRARNLSPQNTPSFTLRQAANARPTTKAASPQVSYTVGEQVKHRVFGEGTILSVKPMANDCMLEIKFGAATKKIMANFANLKKI